MKTVFNDSGQVAHVWAQQSQPSGKNKSGNIYFRDTTIYSYGRHFPIARFVSPGVVLFTDRDYSRTTSGHKQDCRRALSGKIELIFCHNPEANSPREHSVNHQTMVADYRTLLHSASKARGRRADLLRQAEVTRRKANEYRKRFCKGAMSSCPVLPEIADLDNELARMDAADKARATRAANAKAKREAAALAEWENGARDEWKRDGKIDLDRWPAIDAARSHWSAPTDFRLTDADTVRTNLGAEFPRSHCRKAFQAIARCRKAGKTWERNGQQIRVGYFQIDRIEASGDIVAGCHRIRWQEIERFAAEIGLTT